MTRRLLNLVANGAVVLSLLVFITTVVMWVRSYRVPEQWTFAARPGAPVPGIVGSWEQRRFLASSRGRLVLLDLKMPDLSSFPGGRRVARTGYQRGASVGDANPGPFAGATGERQWSLPGIQFFSRPPQVIPATSPPTPGPMPGTFLGAATLSGWRYVGVSWWLPAALSAAPPAAWAWRRRNARTARRRNQNLCVRCGYDLRATPDRCPECGSPA